MNRLLIRSAVVLSILVAAVALYALLARGRDERMAALLADTTTDHAVLANSGLTVHKTWSDPDGQHAHASLDWENRTELTFRMRLSVQCVAEDALGDMVAEAKTTLFARDVGPIAPGSRHEIDVVVPIRGVPHDSIACRVTEAR